MDIAEQGSVPQDSTRHITRITESGKARFSAISRDGRYVAYVENDGDQYSLWVKQRRHRREDASRSTPAASAGVLRASARTASTSISPATAPDAVRCPFSSASRSSAASRRPFLKMSIRPSVSLPMGASSCSMRGADPESHIVVAAAEGGYQRILARRKSPLAFSVSRRTGPLTARSWRRSWSMAGPIRDRSFFSRWTAAAAASSTRAPSGIGRLRWLPDGSGLLTVISERLERRVFGRRLGRRNLAHRLPKRSSRTSDVRSGQPRSVLPGHRRGWEHRRERRQYARVGPLDCPGRSPGRGRAGHFGSPRGLSSQLVTGQRHGGVSRLERTLECRPQGRPGIHPAVA